MITAAEKKHNRFCLLFFHSNDQPSLRGKTLFGSPDDVLLENIDVDQNVMIKKVGGLVSQSPVMFSWKDSVISIE